MPEIVEDGQTGFICDSLEEMVLAIRRLGELDRTACRAYVAQHYSAPQMATGYERLYATVQADGEHMPAHVAAVRPQSHPAATAARAAVPELGPPRNGPTAAR